MKGVVGFFSMDARALAWFALVDIATDGALHARPPVVSSNEFLGLVSSWVSSCDRVMMFANDVGLKSFIGGRNVYAMFVCNKSISMVFPILIFRIKSVFDNLVVGFGFDVG